MSCTPHTHSDVVLAQARKDQRNEGKKFVAGSGCECGDVGFGGAGLALMRLRSACRCRALAPMLREYGSTVDGLSGQRFNRMAALA